MGDQQKIILDAVDFPIANAPAIMLFFDCQFFESKDSFFKNFHHVKGDRNHASFFAVIAHQDGTKLILFKYAVAFPGDFFISFKKSELSSSGRGFLSPHCS